MERGGDALSGGLLLRRKPHLHVLHGIIDHVADGVEAHGTIHALHDDVQQAFNGLAREGLRDCRKVSLCTHPCFIQRPVEHFPAMSSAPWECAIRTPGFECTLHRDSLKLTSLDDQLDKMHASSSGNIC